MKKRIALIGANGQLGSDMMALAKEYPEYILEPLTHAQIEITDWESVKACLDKSKVDVIVNTAAYNRVDDAEATPDKAFLINGIGTKNLAHYAAGLGIPILHVSTDYVFGIDRKRTKPYVETDMPGPINAYGISKLAGELFVQYEAPNHFIVRSSGLFGVVGSSGKGGNFIELMLRIAKEKGEVRVVNDQIVSPTYTVDLAKQIFLILQKGEFGLYHATAQESCSWYEFAKEIFALTHTKVKLEAVSSLEFPTPAKRGTYSVLENAKLKELDLDIMTSWKVGLKNYLIQKGYVKE